MMGEYRRMLGLGAVSLGLFAAAMSGGVQPTHAVGGVNDGTLAADWPEASRVQAQTMIEKYGKPNHHDDTSLTWFGLYGGKRTIVYRKEPNERMIEQAVHYRVPARKVGDLKNFDARITIERQASELSVRTDSIRTNFLILNLAHEISSGFKSVAGARLMFTEQMRLEKDGKTSRYRDGLIFVTPKSPRKT